METTREAIHGIWSGFDWRDSVMGWVYWNDVITALSNELGSE